MRNLIYITTLIISFAASQTYGQVDTIRLQDKRLLTSVLKPALNQYLVYFQAPKDKKKLGLSLWLRDIKTTTVNGEKVFTISQHWYGSDTNSYRTVYSINKQVDFAPVYHSETLKDKINAYNWGTDKITGADTVANNTRKGFALDFKLANFNWNLDIETFEMLPLAAGKTFAINFYDAGLSPPEWVIYKVIGSEIISTLNSEKIDCWKLFTEGEYKGNKYSETYWISKKDHEFLKEQDSFNGGFRYKIKMIGASPDLVQVFSK